jgi:hypothetical protein
MQTLYDSCDYNTYSCFSNSNNRPIKLLNQRAKWEGLITPTSDRLNTRLLLDPLHRSTRNASFPWLQAVVDAPLTTAILRRDHHRVGRDSPPLMPHVYETAAGYGHQPHAALSLLFPPATCVVEIGRANTSNELLHRASITSNFHHACVR